MKQIALNIGEVFEFEGVKLEVVESELQMNKHYTNEEVENMKNTCKKACYFYPNNCYQVNYKCLGQNRLDKKDVIYKEIAYENNSIKH